MVARRLVRVVALATTVAALFIITPVWAASSAPRRFDAVRSLTKRQMSPQEFVRRLRSGDSQEYIGLTVTGTLDLTSLGTVERQIQCLGCTFDGSIIASGVVFQRTVVLGGARVKGSMAFSGTLFQGGFFLRTASVGPSASAVDPVVEGESDFSLATFAGSAGFDGATLSGPAKFDGTRFESDASFADTNFVQGASFYLARFVGTALLTGSPRTTLPSSVDACLATRAGSIAGAATFRQASFDGTADFRGRCFSGHPDFRNVSFGGVANFSQALFLGAPRADFGSSTFQANGLFLATIFEKPASFDLVTAARSLQFEGALFFGEASFDRLTVAGSLSFREARFAPGRSLDLTRLSAGDLAMDPHDVSHLEEGDNGRSTRQREAVLALIESSARKDGDLALANDARYQNLSLQHNDLTGWSRFFDGFFYRLVGGYLVRPINPLRFFVLLLLIGMVVRGIGRIAELAAARATKQTGARIPPVAVLAIPLLVLFGTVMPWQKDRRRTAPGGDGGTAVGGEGTEPAPETDSRPSPAKSWAGRATLGLTKLLSAFVEGLGDSVTVAFRRKPDIKIADRNRVIEYVVAAIKWIEFLAFKALIAVFLLCLANANSTLRDLIDSVKG